MSEGAGNGGSSTVFGTDAPWPAAALLMQADSITIASLPGIARIIMRGGEEVRVVASTAARLELPSQVLHATVQGPLAALRLGPDEWQIRAPRSELDRITAALDEALASIAHARVDVSDAFVGIGVSGPLAEEVIATGCPLDLTTAAFPLGMCTRTVFAKCEIVLLRTARQRFELETARSFGQYCAAQLCDGARALRALSVR